MTEFATLSSRTTALQPGARDVAHAPAPPASLGELLEPVSLATLVEHLNARRLLHLRGSRADRFNGLFSWTHLEEILARGVVDMERLFVFVGGRQIDPVRLGVIDAGRRFDPTALRTLFRQGATFSLANIQGHFEATRRLVSDVEWRLGERVELRVIASPSSGEPIPLHFDSPDLLVLQIDGEKQWRFFGKPVPGSGRYRTLPERPGNVTAEVHMRPGDLLFIPSGLHHECDPEGNSLHLAISIYRRTGMDFVDHVRSLAADDLLFSDGLPQLASDQAIIQHEAKLKHRLIELIETADLRRFLREDGAHRARPRQIALHDDAPVARGSDTFLLPAWSRPLTDINGRLRAGSHGFTLAPPAHFAFDRVQATGGIATAELIDAVDMAFGNGSGEPAVATLIAEGLIQAVIAPARQ